MVVKWKTETVKRLADKISNSNSIGLVNIAGIPSKQFQQIRKTLRGKAELYVIRNNLIRLALEKTGKKDLATHINNSTGIILSDFDPFKLKRLVDGCRINAPAKSGSISPYDIVVPAGDTPFAPGPIIGDLQKVGIKAQIQSGKIVVKEDSLVVKKGERISWDLAGMLARLGIEPREIGLNLKAVYEKGLIYMSDVLGISDEDIRNKIRLVYQYSLNLALNSKIYNKASVPYLIQSAHDNAKNLAINAGIINKETIDILLAKAHGQMAVLKSMLPPETSGQ